TPQTGVLVRPCLFASPVGSKLEPVEESAEQQAGGRRRFCSEFQPQKARQWPERCRLGDWVTQSNFGQAPRRFSARYRASPRYVQPIWAILPCFGPDPAVPGAQSD